MSRKPRVVCLHSHLEWSGEMNELEAAQRRLFVVVPVTLALILLLVYGSVKNGIDTAIVAMNIPIACAGGIVALLVTRVAFSVSAAMGFISVFGIAVQDAILVVTSFQRFRAAGTIRTAYPAFSSRLRCASAPPLSRKAPVCAKNFAARWGGAGMVRHEFEYPIPPEDARELRRRAAMLETTRQKLLAIA